MIQVVSRAMSGILEKIGEMSVLGILGLLLLPCILLFLIYFGMQIFDVIGFFQMLTYEPKPEDTILGPRNAPEPLDEALIGQIGTASTALRLGGAVEVDGQAFEALSEVEMIDPGQQVKVVGLNGTQLLVSPIDET